MPKKISDLPIADDFSGFEQVLVVQDGMTKRLPVSEVEGPRGPPGVDMTTTVYEIIDSDLVDLDPDNGGIQFWTLNADRTPSATSFTSGQRMFLHVDPGQSHSIDWSAIELIWVDGVSADLVAGRYAIIELWRAGFLLFGKYHGTVAMPLGGQSLGLDFRSGWYRRGTELKRSLLDLSGTTFSQSGNCWEAGPGGGIYSFTASKPRIVPGLGLWARSALVNHAQYSNTPAHAVWNMIGISKTSTNNPDPFGGAGAMLATADGTNNPHYANNSSTVSYVAGSTYTLSLIVAPGTANLIQLTFSTTAFGPNLRANFLLDGAGSVTVAAGGTATIRRLLDGRYRISFTAVALTSVASSAGTFAIISAANALRLAFAASTGSLYVTGWSLVAGSQPGPIIPTLGASASNGGSVLSLTHVQPDEDFVLLASINLAEGVGHASPSIAQLRYDANNRCLLRLNSGGALVSAWRVGGVDYNSPDLPIGLLNGRGVVALRRQAGKVTTGGMRSGAGPLIGTEGDPAPYPTPPFNTLQVGNEAEAFQLDGVVESVEIHQGGNHDDAWLAAQLNRLAA